jgi:hypothetical protein
MPIYDPRQVILILEDLQTELGRWGVTAGSVIHAAEYAQRHTREYLDRTAHRVAMAKDQLLRDRDRVEQIKDKVSELLSRSNEGYSNAQGVLNTAKNLLDAAIQTLKKWKRELEIAIAWQERAEERVRRAEIELAKAERELAHAISALDSARAALNRCKNTYTTDSNGRRHYRDCSGEKRTVERAEEAVYEARQWVLAARAELADAQAELSRAIRRVQCCTNAVNAAQRAVELAEQSSKEAQQALNAAEQSRELVQSAEKAVERANTIFKREDEEVDTLFNNVASAIRTTEEAQRYLTHGERSEESGQRLNKLVRGELENRTNALRMLNHHDITSVVIGSSSGASVTHTAASVGPTSTGGIGSRFLNFRKKPPKIRNIEIVDVSMLPTPDDIYGEEDFKKYSLEEMSEGIKRWQEMLPVIEKGESEDPEYWSQLDASQGLDYSNGYRRVFDTFYGDEAIRIEKDGNTYNIINGRYRIWLAKQFGISFLPAEIIEVKRIDA